MSDWCWSFKLRFLNFRSRAEGSRDSGCFITFALGVSGLPHSEHGRFGGAGMDALDVTRGYEKSPGCLYVCAGCSLG